MGLSIELNKDPLATVQMGEACGVCKGEYWLYEADKEPICVCCCIAKAENGIFFLYGWRISKSARQLIAIPR